MFNPVLFPGSKNVYIAKGIAANTVNEGSLVKKKDTIYKVFIGIKIYQFAENS